MTTGIALIGSGIFAKEEHLPAILSTPSLSLLAIYSRSLTSAKALSSSLQQDVHLYSEDSGSGKGYEDLLKREDIKGVIIALPIPAQPEYIKKALKAGKHVLSEKPIAQDIPTAQDLITFYRTQISGPTLSIAENFRYLDSFSHAAQQISSLGRILGFRVRVQNLVAAGGKYYETAWRKKPEYQGGFLLDGGVHFIAATRLMLGGGEEGKGKGERISRVSAFTAQLQEHLPPVDTFDATMRTESGVSGTVSLSFGTTFSGSEYAVACEEGTVFVSRGKVTVTRAKDKTEEVKEFPEEVNGVKQEVKAWAQALESGKPDQKQSPEEAIRDLEVLEACLRSGESGGQPVDLKL